MDFNEPSLFYTWEEVQSIRNTAMIIGFGGGFGVGALGALLFVALM